MAIAFYNYAIKGIKEYDTNKKLCEIMYGGDNKQPLIIYKDDVKSFVHAVLPSENDQAFTHNLESAIKQFEDENDLEPINALLEGRAMILVTNLKSVSEYINDGQNSIQYITSMKLDGSISKDTAFDYATHRVSFEDLYPSHFSSNNRNK